MPPRRSTRARRLSRISRDLKRCRHYLQTRQYHCIKYALQRSTREYRRALFRTQELRGCLHQAIPSGGNLAFLEFLVRDCEAPMEVTNFQGMTPLYMAVYLFWVEGAMFLLNHGASVHNADQSLSNAVCMLLPFVHAVVRTKSETLLREVIRRGADISVLDWEGRNCLEVDCHLPSCFVQYVQEEMKKANLLQEESILTSRPLPQNRSVFSCKETTLVEGLITDQHSQDPRKTMLLRGAWHVTKGDYASAFACWKDLFHSLGTGADESIALSRAWTGIIHMNDRGLLEEGSLSEDNEVNYNIFALLVIATYAPAGKKLFMPIEGILDRLFHQNKVATSIDFMKHLTAVRLMYKFEVTCLVWNLQLIFGWNSLESAGVTDFSLLVDSVTIASRCLSALTMDGPFSTDKGPTTRHDKFPDNGHCNVCGAVCALLGIFLSTMRIYQRGVQASKEQLQCFYSHIKDFLCTFPWMFGKNIFHRLEEEKKSRRINTSSIKTLVALSAEARGTNRHENMPPHLAPNQYGDTPLHVYTRSLLKEDLVEEGVLQCLLDHGAHLCIRNNQGESVRDILVRRGLLPEAERLPSLQCLAAAAFMKDANLRERVQHCRPQKIRQILLDH